MNENEENFYAETFAVYVYVERERYTQHSSNLRASLEQKCLHLFRERLFDFFI